MPRNPTQFAGKTSEFVRSVRERVDSLPDSADPIRRELAVMTAQLVEGSKRKNDPRTFLSALRELERLLTSLEAAAVPPADSGVGDGGAGDRADDGGGLVAGILGAGPEVRDAAES